MKICGLDMSMNSPGKCILDLDDKTFEIKDIKFYGYNMVEKRCLVADNVEIICVGNKFPKKGMFERINIAIEILNKDMEDVKFIGMEGYSFGSKKSGSILQLAEMTGNVKQFFYNQGKGIIMYPPSATKLFATESGSAEKNLMEFAFKTDYPQYYPKVIDSLPEYDSPKSDLIDAFHLAMILKYHISFEAKIPLSEEIIYKLSRKSSKKVSSILETEMFKKKSN